MFTKKEILAFENEYDIRFTSIYFGGVSYSAHFAVDQPIQSCFNPIFLSLEDKQFGLYLSLSLSGFRNELLPLELEAEAKAQVKEIIANGIHWVLSLQETDLDRRKGINPELQVVKGKIRLVV